MLSTQFFVLSSNGSTRRLRLLVVIEPALAGCQPMFNLEVNRGLAGCCYFLPSGQTDSAQMRLFAIAPAAFAIRLDNPFLLIRQQPRNNFCKWPANL